MSESRKSWNAFSTENAMSYLRTFGHPAVSSKFLLLDVIRSSLSGIAKPSILDLGCGNAQLYGFFKENGLPCDYTGVDFSEPLLLAAQIEHPEANIIQSDLNQISANISGKFDFVIYSHVLELLESPGMSLNEAKKFSDKILIRFYEPPEFDFDTVELREMDLGAGTVTYLRRKMSRDCYSLMLAKIGCVRVDVYKDSASKDQVHLLNL